MNAVRAQCTGGAEINTGNEGTFGTSVVLEPPAHYPRIAHHIAHHGPCLIIIIRSVQDRKAPRVHMLPGNRMASAHCSPLTVTCVPSNANNK